MRDLPIDNLMQR
jgi:hypothetical protein